MYIGYIIIVMFSSVFYNKGSLQLCMLLRSAVQEAKGRAWKSIEVRVQVVSTSSAYVTTVYSIPIK